MSAKDVYGMQRSRPKSDYAGQISSFTCRERRREQSLKLLGRKNGFTEQTTAKFVRPVPRTVGFAACRAAARAKPQGPSVAPAEGDPIGSEHAGLAGTVRELRTADFKQIRPRLVREPA